MATHGVHLNNSKSPLEVWHPTNASLNNVLRVEHLVGVSKISASESNQYIEHLRDKVLFALQTNGDGKCGAHAVFGFPSLSQGLKVANTGVLIRDLLPD